MSASSVPAFYVREIPIHGELILSPMAGYSDLPFRSLCRELGSAMSYTGFINARDVLAGSPAVQQKTKFNPEERPVVFQLYDDNLLRLQEAALRLQEQEPDIIDINMGCSVRRISGRGAGAGLMRDPQKIGKIFYELSHKLSVPVSGKIRLGWDENNRNYLLVARVIAENGGALVAVHGRTRQQSYDGNADWDAIAEVKQSLSIPVIGNGDVKTTTDIAALKNMTGCDGVMIGRGAIGNPWIFSGFDRQQVSPRLIHRTMLKHLDRMRTFYGQERGLILFRKHLVQYISPLPVAKADRQRLLTTEKETEFVALLDTLALAN